MPPDGQLPGIGVASASMKYGITAVRPRRAAIAATSREYHRSSAGLFGLRTRPPGSLRRRSPATRAGPSGSAAALVRRSARSGGTNPRLTRTVTPLGVTTGVRTQKPLPCSVTACTSVSRSCWKRPTIMTWRYCQSDAGRRRQSDNDGAVTGGAWILSSTASIRASFHVRRSTCQMPRAVNRRSPAKARPASSHRPFADRRSSLTGQSRAASEPVQSARQASASCLC